MMEAEEAKSKETQELEENRGACTCNTMGSAPPSPRLSPLPIAPVWPRYSAAVTSLHTR